MGLIYIIGCAAIIMFGLITIAANVVNAAAVECDDKIINWWLKATNFMQAIIIMVLLIYFVCSVI